MNSCVVVWRFAEPSPGCFVSFYKLAPDEIEVVNSAMKWLQENGDNGEYLPYPEELICLGKVDLKCYTQGISVGLRDTMEDLVNQSRYDESIPGDYYHNRCVLIDANRTRIYGSSSIMIKLQDCGHWEGKPWFLVRINADENNQALYEEDGSKWRVRSTIELADEDVFEIMLNFSGTVDTQLLDNKKIATESSFKCDSSWQEKKWI